MEGNGKDKQYDLDKITDTLAPEDSSVGGLLVSGKDRVVFRPLKKSILGLDMLANAKRMESKVEGSFKKPKERVASIASSQDEGEEMPVSSGIDDVENATSSGLWSYSNRRYRESASNETSNLGSVVTEDANTIEASPQNHSDKRMNVRNESVQSSRSRSPSLDYAKSDRGRSKYDEHYRSSDREGRTPKDRHGKGGPLDF